MLPYFRRDSPDKFTTQKGRESYQVQIIFVLDISLYDAIRIRHISCYCAIRVRHAYSAIRLLDIFLYGSIEYSYLTYMS